MLLKNKKILIPIISVLSLLLIAGIAFSIRGVFFKEDKPVVKNEASPTTRVVKSDVKISKIEPIKSDKTGVDVTSGFKITSDKEYDVKKLKTALKITPDQPYSVEKISKREYGLKFKETMSPNSVYKFEAQQAEGGKDYSWAFQTKKNFRVVSTLPRNESNNVPTDTGIEISMSHENIEKIDDYFEISPKVEGRFEIRKKMVVFVPKQRLEFGTIYTVTVKSGLGVSGCEDKLENDYTFKFQTMTDSKPEDANSIWFQENLYNFTSLVNPILQINTSESNYGKSVSIDVLKFQNEEEFEKTYKKINDIPFWANQTDDYSDFESLKLEKVKSFNAKIENENKNWYISYVSFPSSLGEGLYLIKIKNNKSFYRTLIQVNDTSNYISVGKDKTLIWLNDSKTGKPVEGAKIETEGKDSVISNSDGLAVIEGNIKLKEDNSNYLFKIRNGDKPTYFAYLPIYSVGQDEEAIGDLYWSYIYLDRGLYLPKDNLKIWGMIKPRDKAQLPEKVDVQLYRYDFSYFEENNLPGLMTKSVKLDASGQFVEEMELDNLEGGSYSIRVKTGDKVIMEKSFEVKEYTKPAYKIEVNADKEVLYSWEKVNFDVQASFYEGSPVSGLKLDYDVYPGDGNEGVLDCGEDGHSVYSILPQKAIDTTSWRPTNLTLDVTNNKAEEAQISSSKSITVFPKDLMIEAKIKRVNNKGQVSIKTNNIDISKLEGKRQDFDYYHTDSYRGETVDKRLNAKVYEKHWESKVVGEYYDFINKKVEKKYEYYEVENLVKQLDVNTSNGLYNFDFPIEDKNGYRYYYVKINGRDSAGRAVEEIVELYSSWYYDYQNNNYAVVEKNEKSEYKLGEKVELTLKKGGKEISQNSNSRVMYIVRKNGIVDYKIQDSLEYSFEMDKKSVPNVHVQAVYFDGKNVFMTYQKPVIYDYDEKELKINVKPQKTDYKPGDTVNLNVEVKDVDGKPVSSNVNISVVDEAFFAVQNQNVNTLYSLYEYKISSGEITNYISYKEFNPNTFGGAEGGEGGDIAIRSNLKDNAFFDCVKTDSDGKASISFKLPDNLTSWRITYQTISDDLQAANGKININTKLPFFVDVIFNKIFMENDSPEIIARTYGTALKNGDDVTYEAVIESKDGLNESIKANGKSFEFTSIPLGKLKEGEYSVTVKVKCKDYTDAIKKEFVVTKNILESGRVKNYKLSNELKPEGGKALTTLEFYNKDVSEFANTLWTMLYTWGERVDQKLCRKLAAELLNKHFDEAKWWDEEYNFEDYQLSDGGIALLSYASSDPELSAKICSISRDDFDTNSLRLYFYNVLDNKESTKTQLAAALWGLASLNEPVLIDVKNALTNKDLSTKEKIYLILALVELGDYSATEEEYNKLVGDKLKKVDPIAYINDGTNKDEIIENTALCSLIALKLNKPEKEGLYKYVKINPSKELLANYELMCYTMNTIPNTNKEGKFTYEIDGVKKDVVLKKVESFKMQLTKKSLSSLKFSNIQGDIDVLSSFKGSVKDLYNGKESIVKLTRSYSGKNNTFNQSDLVKVTLKPEFLKEAPDGYYEVIDVLPCGLRYVEGKPYIENRCYPYEVSGQKVIFGIYYSKNSKENIKDMIYYARAVSPGSFTADNAIIKHYDSNVAGFAKQENVNIKN